MLCTVDVFHTEHMFHNIYIIEASLSKPHTSGKNGTNVAFIKIYVEILINGMSVMRSQNFTFKN